MREKRNRRSGEGGISSGDARDRAERPASSPQASHESLGLADLKPKVGKPKSRKGATSKTASSGEGRGLALKRPELSQPAGKVAKLDSQPGGMLLYPLLEDKKRAYVALVTDLFKLTPAEAEREYEQRLSSQFGAAVQHGPVEPSDHTATLRIPPGKVPRFKGKAAEVYQFLLDTYHPREGSSEPLTLSYLRENDMAAVNAFRSRRRSEPIPKALLVLTKERLPSKELTVIEKYGVDLESPTGVAEARKLMSAINNRLYRPSCT